MVALPSGKQRSMHEPAVNVPSKVDTICDVSPRLPSQSELVPLKLKRKVAYRGHYMYDYITPQKLIDALIFLKANNYCLGRERECDGKRSKLLSEEFHGPRVSEHKISHDGQGRL